MIEECVNMDDFEQPETELCPKCKRNEKESPHTCPYQVDVNNDREFTCNCCNKCEHECAMDI